MTITARGSQNREPLAESGYTLLAKNEDGDVILMDEDGKKELWAAKDDFAGYVLEIDGIGHEFVRTALMGDLWWAGVTDGTS